MRWQGPVWLIPAEGVVRLLVVVLLLGGLVLWCGPRVQRTLAPPAEFVSGKMVVVDPGHGGMDPGCIAASGLLEKEVVLDIAHRLAAYFRSAAVQVVLVRKGDHDLADHYPGPGTRKFRDISARLQLIKRVKPDLVLSLHANSFPSPVWFGAQTFYPPGSQEGKKVAVSIQSALVKRLGPNNRQAKMGDFKILTDSPVTAVMVEVGFLSNPREAGLLAQPRYREQVAGAIFEGVVRYWLGEGGKGHDGGAVPSNGKVHQPAPGPPKVVKKPLAPGEVALFFAGPTNMDDRLIPEVRTLPGLEGEKNKVVLVRRAVEELIKGPGEKSILTPLLPPTTRLVRVQMQGDLVWLDFDEHLINDFAGGSRTEELAVASLVKTVQEIVPGGRVKITVNGQSGISLGGHLILDHPLEGWEE